MTGEPVTILPPEGTTPEGQEGAAAEPPAGTTPPAGGAPAQEGLIFGKYPTMDEAERGHANMVETLDQLKRENETYAHILETIRPGAAEPGGEPPSAPAPSSLPANAKEEFVRLWNSGEHDKALDIYYGRRLQSLEKAIGETRDTAVQAQSLAELRRYEADPRFPRMRELLPAIEALAQERLARNRDYGKAFKSKDELMDSLYHEVERRRAPPSSPGRGAAGVSGIPPAASRRGVPPVPKRTPAEQNLDPALLKRYGIKRNTDQNKFHPSTLKLMSATAALEELEAQAAG